MRSRILLAAALMAGTTATASAQLSVTPFVGTMVPLANMLTDSSSGGSYYRMKAHTLYGLRLSKQMSPTLTVQLQAGVGKGEFEAASGSTQIVLSSEMWFADLRGRVRLLGTDETNLGLLVGAGWTQFKMGLFDAVHYGTPDTKLSGKATGIVGLGVRAHLVGTTAFTMDLTDRIHAQPIEAAFLSGSTAKKPTQQNVTATFGLNFPLGH